MLTDRRQAINSSTRSRYGRTSIMAAYPQVVSPPPGMVPGALGYGSMSPPPMAGYAQGYPQQASMGFAPMPGYGVPQGMPAMAPRNPQHFSTPPQHSPIPTGATQQKGTLRPGQEIRVGKQVVVVEKYLSEGESMQIKLVKVSFKRLHH